MTKRAKSEHKEDDCGEERYKPLSQMLQRFWTNVEIIGEDMGTRLPPLLDQKNLKD